MKGKRTTIFLTIVMILLGVSACTNPVLKEHVQGSENEFVALYEVVSLEDGEAITKEVLLELAKGLEKRIIESGIDEPDIKIESMNRIRLRLTDVTNKEEIREMLANPFYLTFRGPDGTIELSNSDIRRNGASVVFNSQNEPLVVIELMDASKFKEITTRLTGQYLAIYLGDTELSRPTINLPIAEGVAVIAAPNTLIEAKELASIINLGTLQPKLVDISD